MLSCFRRWLGRWRLGNLILPMTALALPPLAVFARLTRGSMIEALNADHIRTVRAYGLPPRGVVVTHALRGAMLPVVSYLAPCAAALLTGFRRCREHLHHPWCRPLLRARRAQRDYPLVMGTVILVAVFVIVFNLLVDIAYGLLDPRVRND